MSNVLPAIAAAFGSALVLTPIIRWIALELGAVVRPCERSVHTEPKPYLGGLAIYFAFLIAVVAAVPRLTPEVRTLLLGGALVTAIGVIDDRFELRAWVKLLGTVGAALVLVWGGVRIDYVSNPFAPGTYIQLGLLAAPLTVLYVVAIIHVVNLIDGLDGLAAGISSIAALVLLFVSVRTGQAAIAIPLTAALAGGALGFLPYNFNPAKIFMGDAGALFLGYAIAGVSIYGVLKSTTAIALFVPLLALGIPVLDTGFAIVRRMGGGRRVWEADRDHLHHRLLALGLSQRETVIWMYVISGWLGLSAIALLEMPGWVATGVLAFIVASLVFAARRLGLLRTHAPSDRTLPRG